MTLGAGFEWACPGTSAVWGIRRVGADRMLCGERFFTRDRRAGYCPEGDMQPQDVPSPVCGRCVEIVFGGQR